MLLLACLAETLETLEILQVQLQIDQGKDVILLVKILVKMR